MVPNATTLLTTVDFTANALRGMLGHFVSERSVMIHALVRLVVAMGSVLPRKVGNFQSVTATEAGRDTPATKRSISAKKRENLAKIKASVWPILQPVSATQTQLVLSVRLSWISVILTILVNTEECV